MQWYRIKKIRPKDGVQKTVHKSMQNRICQIVDVRVGRRGLLCVDVGDKLIGPHRIVISKVVSVYRTEEDNNVTIETENTIYHLEKCYS